MADTTSFFDLILPGKGEYRDAWWEPINANFTTVDAWAQAVQLEIVAARGSKSTLAAFLTVGHETSGELLRTPEVAAACISPIYGFQTTEELYDLSARLRQVEWEMWYSRESQANLRGAHSFRMPGIKNQILSGSKDANGYPTWISYAGALATVDGRTTNLWMSVDGALGRVRFKHDISFAGKSEDTYYLYAQLLTDDAAGKVVTSGTIGATSMDVNNYPIYFNDSSKDFTALDVKVGDVLVLADTSEKGSYVIAEVAPNTTVTQLKITGQFPVGGLAPITYSIYDPMRLAFAIETTETPAAGKFYIGEIDFDGTSVIDARPRHFLDTFVSEWREIDVSTVPTFEEIFGHNLGSLDLDISVQVSATDDGLSPIEEMSLTTISRNYGLSITSSGLGLTKSDSLSHTPGVLPTFSQGVDTHYDPDAGGSYVQGTDVFTQGSLSAMTGTINYALTGSVTGNITGDVYTNSSVRAKWTRNALWVKNAESGKFYKSYDGTSTQAGFLRVIVRKRG